jgi:hypothetical protein
MFVMMLWCSEEFLPPRRKERQVRQGKNSINLLGALGVLCALAVKK